MARWKSYRLSARFNWKSEFLIWVIAMSSAIELIVDGYARLQDRESLGDLRMHRRRLAVDLKARTGFDCRSSIDQLEQDITAIEAGLEALSGIGRMSGVGRSR